MKRLRGVLHRRHRAVRGSADAGFTLAEMLVVIMILGVVMAVVQTTVIAGNRSVSDTTGRIDSTGQARIAMDSMSRNLRTTVLPQLLASGTCADCSPTAFILGTPTKVQFFANNNNDVTRLGPSKMSYVLHDDGRLVETMQKPDPHAPTDYTFNYCTPGPTCQISERVIATGVETDRLFTYYNRDGSAMNSQNLTASQLSAVDSIDVVVPVVQRGQQTTLLQRVTLPNADTVAEIEEIE